MRWLLTAATVVLIVAACGGDSDTASPDTTGTPTPSATATPTPTPSATPTPGDIATPSPRPTSTDPSAIEMSRGANAPFPDDMVLYVEPGCLRCDGFAGRLVRLYRDPTGEIRSEIILGYEGPSRPWTHDGVSIDSGIRGIVTSADGSSIAIGVCIKESCFSGGIGSWHADSVTVVMRSDDGGITWREVARAGPGVSVVGLRGDGQVLTAGYPEPVPLGKPEYRLHPGNELVTPPAEAGADAWLLIVSEQMLWWANDGRLLNADGTELIRTGRPGDDIHPSQVTGSRLDPDAYLLTIQEGGAGSELKSFAIEGGVATHLQTLFSPERVYRHVWPLQATTVMISIDPIVPATDDHFPLPAMLDVTTGEYRVIEEGFLTDDDPPRWLYGRSYIRGFQMGPFARVVDTGLCLNVRTEPSLAAQVLDCMADGVLLRNLGEVNEAEGVTWVRVSTPAGVEGWASAKYLER